MSGQALTWEMFDFGAEPPAARAAPDRPREAAEAAREDGAQGDSPPEAAPEPTEPLETLLARARGEGRAAGFEAGVAHAEAQGRAELKVILTELRESLQDAAHARLVRDDETVATARRLAQALLEGMAPELARRGLPAELAAAAAEALAGARREAAEPPPRARVAPCHMQAVRRAFAEAQLDLAVEADASLGPLSARLDWAQGEDAIDLDAALDAAGAALERHLPDPDARAAPPQDERRPADGRI